MKSTQSCKAVKHKGKHTRLFVMLGGLLLLIPLLLPATALAAPRSAAATPPLTKPGQIVDLAGVSVVRLALSYVPANAKGNTPIVCTELGTIIASWPAQNTTDKNNWVLTDGWLLNVSTKNTCAPNGRLASIQLLASNEFTSNQPNLAALDTLTCTTAGSCSDAGGTQSILALPTSSAILFSFHTTSPMPYVGVERANTSGEPAPTSIELSANATTNSIPPSAINVNVATLTQFLTPIAPLSAPGSAPATVGTISAQTTEPGMPFVDDNGNITGEQLLNTASLVTITDIENLEKQIPVPQGAALTGLLATNTLSQEWDNGILQYERGNYNGASQTLNSIQNAPPAFKAPATFSALARAKLSRSGTSGSTFPSSHGEANQGSLSSWLIIIGLIAGAMVLVLLFVLVSIYLGRKRIERKELASFEADANRARAIIAEQDARRKLAEEQLASRRIQPDRQVLPAPLQPVIAAPLPQNNVQPQLQQPAPAPKLQDDPAIQAALQRLWDRAGR